MDTSTPSPGPYSIRKYREAMVFTPRMLDRMADQMRQLGLPET